MICVKLTPPPPIVSCSINTRQRPQGDTKTFSDPAVFSASTKLFVVAQTFSLPLLTRHFESLMFRHLGEGRLWLRKNRSLTQRATWPPPPPSCNINEWVTNFSTPEKQLLLRTQQEVDVSLTQIVAKSKKLGIQQYVDLVLFANIY